MRGYFDKNGNFKQVLHGNKAFEIVDGERIEYDVEQFCSIQTQKDFYPPIYSQKDMEGLQQENEALREKSYKYKVGYHSYEESYYIELSHKDKFNDEELYHIIKKCYLQTLLTLKKNDQYFKEDIRFQDLFDADCFLEALIKRGFSRIEYESKLSVFGWSEALNKNDWNQKPNDITYRISEYLEEKLKGDCDEIRK